MFWQLKQWQGQQKQQLLYAWAIKALAGPTKTTNSPFSISKSTLWITSVFPNDLLTFLNSTCAIQISSNEAIKLSKSKQQRKVC